MRLKELKTALATYEVLGVIGEGGTGKVYRVRDSDDAPYAAKVLDPGIAGGERRRRFKNELQFCQRTEHRNIVKVLDAGVTEARPGGDTPFFIMPLYSGTLRSLLRTSPPGPADVLPLFKQVLDGVEAAHLQGVYHRDIKPENVLYDAAARRLVVADFGVAHFGEGQLQTLVETQPGTRLANFLYAAPEQRARDKAIDQRADIYALGLILNELFTGEVLQGTGFASIGSKHGDYGFLDPIVERMVRQNPQERYASLDEVKQELIGRGQAFVERQRLDALRTTVVPESEVSDVLIASPPVIVSFDWKNDELTVKLSVSPTTDWIRVFHGLGGFSYYSQFGGPEAVRFEGDRAVVLASAAVAEGQATHFRQWLASTVTEYEAKVRRDHTERLRKERDALARKVAQEEERERVLARVRGGGRTP